LRPRLSTGLGSAIIQHSVLGPFLLWRVQVVHAERNPIWTPEASGAIACALQHVSARCRCVQVLEKLDGFSDHHSISRHLLAKSGHWVHVDQPENLIATMSLNWPLGTSFG
jgi:hypothetical protein